MALLFFIFIIKNGFQTVAISMPCIIIVHKNTKNNYEILIFFNLLGCTQLIEHKLK